MAPANAAEPSIDQTDFDAFAHARSADLVRFAYLLVGNHHVAEDLVQQVLANLYFSWSRIRRRAAVDAYVRTALLRAAISWRRRAAVRWERPTDVLPEVSTGASADTTDIEAALESALRQLPPRQRAAVVLRYYCDYSEAEAADSLGCSVGNVKSLTSRGVQRLRSGLLGSELSSKDPGRPPAETEPR